MASLSPSIEKLVKKLDKEPNSLIFLQLAEEYRKEGEYEHALRTCRDGLRRHPNYWSARVALGRIHREMGDPEKAREELERVIKAVPDNLLANKLLGDIYRESGKLPEALKRYQIVQMLTPNDQEVASAIGVIEGKLTTRPAAPPPPPAPKPEPVPAAVPPPLPESIIEASTEPAMQVELPPEPPPMPQEPPSFLEKTAPGVRLGGLDALDSTMPQDSMFLEDLSSSPVPESVPEEPEIPTEELASMFLESAHSNEVPDASPFGGVDEEQFPSFMGGTEFPAPKLPAQAPVSASRPEDRTQPMQDKEELGGEYYGDELTTQTLAELYVQQGLTDKAVRVYQKLLLNDPGNAQIVQRLRDLNPADALLSMAAGAERDSAALDPHFKPPENSKPSATGTMDVASDERRRKITTLENWLATIRRERS